jgi:hypothetical protein
VLGSRIGCFRVALATSASLTHAGWAAAQVAGDEADRSGSAIAGVGIHRTIASNLPDAVGLRLGFRDGSSDGVLATLDASRSERSDVSEWQVLGSTGWLWARDLGPVRWWVGASAGAGFVMQTTPGRRTLASGVVGAGPMIGVEANLSGRIGLWGEAQLFGLLYRRDHEPAASPSPSAWLGASFAF